MNWLSEYARTCNIPVEKVQASEFANVVEFARRNHRSDVEKIEGTDFEASVQAILSKLQDEITLED